MTKILHQVWIQGEADLPGAYRMNRERWRALLPDDWEMILWDEARATAQWPDYASISERCFHHATRCDIILARAQRDIGGLACGTDVIPLRVQELLQWLELNGTLVVVNPGARSASNGISYSAEPGHPFWQCLCRHQLRNGGARLGDSNVWASTGPRCWYEALQARLWSLSLATDTRAYGKEGDGGNAWVDPGCAGSWHS